MSEKYTYFVEKYFDGDMPKNVVFKTNMTKDEWGLATCRFKYGGTIYNRTVETTDFTIKMSNAYVQDEHSFETTMLHEMIHIYDYYHYPTHFVRFNGRNWVKVKGYDPHGEFFMSCADRMISDGYEISRHVSKSMADNATESESLIRREANKANKVRIIGFAKFNDKYNWGIRPAGDYRWFKTSENMLETIVTNTNRYGRDRNGVCTYSELYIFRTYSDSFDRYQGCRGTIKGWTVTKEEAMEIINNPNNRLKPSSFYRFIDGSPMVSHGGLWGKTELSEGVQPKKKVDLNNGYFKLDKQTNTVIGYIA